MASLWSLGPNVTWTKPAVLLLCEWNCYIVITRLKGMHVRRLYETTQSTVLLSLTYPLTVSLWLLCWDENLLESFPSKHQLSPDQRCTCHSLGQGPLARHRRAQQTSSERKLLPAGLASKRMPYWKGLPEVSPPMFGYLLPLFTNSITSPHGSPLKRYELLILLTHCASAKGRLESTNWFYTRQV